MLLFVFQPTLDLAGLGGLALAATVAAASKYLLALRGRHIFNPAAVGAFVVGAPGLAFAVVVGRHAALLPFVTVGALLVLFRTRRISRWGSSTSSSRPPSSMTPFDHRPAPRSCGAHVRPALVADLVLRRLHAERAAHPAAPSLAADRRSPSFVAVLVRRPVPVRTDRRDRPRNSRSSRCWSAT